MTFNLVSAVYIGLGLLAGGIRFTTTRSCDVPLQAYNLTTLHSQLRYLESSSNSSDGRQVIIPEMRFDCAGYVTAWSAHTLVLTRPNYLEILKHGITFQVWRPDPSNNSYTLVGSNMLEFSGQSLRDNVMMIPDRTDMGYFSFVSSVSASEQIHFLAGDVVGWFIPTQYRTNLQPLSVLFINGSRAAQSGGGGGAVDMLALTRSREPCMVCDVLRATAGGSGSDIVITSVLPFVSASYATYTLHGSCEPYTCETALQSWVTPTPTSSMMEATRVAGTGTEQEPWLDSRVTSAVHLFTAATVLGILIIQVIFCGYGIIKLKRLHQLLGDGQPPPMASGRNSLRDHTLQSCDYRVKSHDQYCDSELTRSTVERKQSYLVTPRCSLESAML